MTVELPDLSKELAAHVRGWINQYVKINMRILQPVMSTINDKLVKWAQNRHKRFKGSAWQARKWLKLVYRDYPNTFVHWQYGFKP